jgi:hypothetical protein
LAAKYTILTIKLADFAAKIKGQIFLPTNDFISRVVVEQFAFRVNDES